MQFVLDVFGLALAVGSLAALRIYREMRAMRKDMEKDMHELLSELADTTGRVVNLEAAAKTWIKNEKRNGNTA